MQTQTILIVDDTPANVKLLSAYLEHHGFSVAVAQDGEQGMRLAQSIQPDLILLDAMMPAVDGFETCRRLKASVKTKDIPVIFMSATSDTSHKVAGFKAGGVDYLTKPFQIEEVLARVTTHMTLRALQKQLAEQNLQLQQQIAVRRQVETELQDAYDGLEERVVQRTAELAQVNASLETENIERQQAEQRIRYMAHYDALTGLPNRILLQDRIGQAIAYAHRNMTQLAILYIDLDYFKHVNDSLGHQTGDRLLKTVALRLQQCLREGDSVARIGGDEFVLSLPLQAGSSDSAVVAQKVLDALDLLFTVERHELHVSASIGISVYPDNGTDAESLMRAADTAMYYAKEKGRSNYQFFTPALNKAAQRRLGLANRLRRALERDEFMLHYQPQIDLESGTIFSSEALLRHRQSGRKVPISCGPFITVAEETGLIVPIGEWVLRKACQQLKYWHNLGYPKLRIAVNLSPRQFSQPNFQNMIKQILDEAGLSPNALDLELTESILLQRSDDNIAMLKQLSDMGIQLSIDDFGTGYSSLAYLQRFPIHALKIDRSFVNGIGRNSNDTALVTAIIAMAQSLHLKVLAEGVETAQQVGFLMSHGCLSAQGFYYSEAVAAEDFTDLLRNQDTHILRM
ncbi:MAG: hypothetical protein JWQ21_4076 [Herminiimonas sp.]|nr:hypothetical protein [Herminiimonas sp.]